MDFEEKKRGTSTMNPLSRIPKRQDLPKGPSLYEQAKSIAPNVVREMEEPAMEVRNTGKLLYNAAMGEDAEGLPLGAEFIPGVSLAAKLKQGKTPGLFDFMDVPSVKGLTGLKTLGAMGPLATTLKDFKAGGRFGKTLRNLEKAKNPVIERWHRTRTKNARNIKNKGLLVGKDNPNYGINTGDSDQFPIPVAWFGNNPTEIPVLQLYNMDKRNLIDTYRVRIPKDIYYNTPRLKWESGYRGNPKDAIFVEKGKPSLTGEVGRRTGLTSKIDLFGSSVPPEWLERIPQKTVDKWAKHDEQMKYFALNNYAQDVAKKMSKSDIGNDIVRQWMNDWTPITDRVLLAKMQPFDKTSTMTPKEQLYNNAMRYGHGIPKYGLPVYSEDIPDKFKVKPGFWYDTKYPQYMSQYSEGAISRGWLPDRSSWNQPMSFDSKRYWDKWDAKKRVFDWKKYNEYVKGGFAPSYATSLSAPKFYLVDTPNGLELREPSNFATDVSIGHVSRGTGDHKGPTGSLYQLASDVLDNVYTPDATRNQLKDIFSAFERERVDNRSKAMEAISNSTGKLKNLQAPMYDITFKAANGAITRGNDYYKPKKTLKQVYDDYVEQALVDADWQYDMDDPNDVYRAVDAAHSEAADQLREYMKDISTSTAPVRSRRALKDIMKGPDISNE